MLRQPREVRLRVTALLAALAAALACDSRKSAPPAVEEAHAEGDAEMAEMLLGVDIVGGPAVTSWADGRVDAFTRGPDNALTHIALLNRGWSAPVRFRSPIATNEDPAAVSWGPERIDVAVRGLDGLVYHLWCQGQAMCDGPDYGIHSLGELAPGVAVASAPAMTSWGENHLEIFVVGSDARLWQMTWNNAWSGWRPLPDGALTSKPAAVSMGPGTIDVFARGTDMALYQNRFEENTWKGWIHRGGSLADGPSASKNRNAIEVFVRGAENGLYKATLDPAWSGYQLLYTGIASAPASVTWRPTHTTVFARSANEGELLALGAAPTAAIPYPEPPVFEAQDHASAGQEAVKEASCSAYLIDTLRLLDPTGPGKMTRAQAWANDPDCFDDNCDGLSFKEMADPEVWACWALRNPDHFTTNPAWRPSPYSPPFDPFQVKPTRRRGFQDNADAIALLEEYAIAKVDSSTNVADHQTAARAALRACHYVTDRMACGHAVGNKVCDPAAATLTEECRQFVEVNRKRLSSCGIFGFVDQSTCAQEAVDVTLMAGAGQGGTYKKVIHVPVCQGRLSSGGYDWYTAGDAGRTDAFRYAAAERIIRHRANGTPLLEPDGTEARTNDCFYCPDGECLVGTIQHPSANPRNMKQLIDACRKVLDETICRSRNVPRDKVSVLRCECPTGPGLSAVADPNARCTLTGGECRDAEPGESGAGSCDAAASDPLPIFCCGDGRCSADAGEDCGTCAEDCGCQAPFECEEGVCTCTDVNIPPAECGVTACGRVLPDCPAGASCVDNLCVPDRSFCGYRCQAGACVAERGNGPTCAPADPSRCPSCDVGGSCSYYCDAGTCTADRANGASCGPADPSKCPPCGESGLCSYFCWGETCVADDSNESTCQPASSDKCSPACETGGGCQGPCCGDPCCGDPCCGDPCCGDPCCGDPCCGDPCCGDPCCGDAHCSGGGGEVCEECH